MKLQKNHIQITLKFPVINLRSSQR